MYFCFCIITSHFLLLIILVSHVFSAFTDVHFITTGAKDRSGLSLYDDYKDVFTLYLADLRGSVEPIVNRINQSKHSCCISSVHSSHSLLNVPSTFQLRLSKLLTLLRGSILPSVTHKNQLLPHCSIALGQLPC